MQTWSGQNTGGVSAPTRKLVTTILVAFSLAGLVIGFAVGGLTHPQSTPTGNTGPVQKPTVTAQTTATVPPTATLPPDVVLGLPMFTSYSTTESATGNTHYTVKIQANDKKKKPVHSGDITCKLWLVQQIPDNQILNIDPKVLKNVTNLVAPIQGTLNGQPVVEVPGLLFDKPGAQTTTCDDNGQTTWKYTIVPTLPPGIYDLVILTDWKGRHYNWSWVNITIK